MKKYLMPFDVWSKLVEHVANINDKDFVPLSTVNEFIKYEHGLVDLNEAVVADPDSDYDDKAETGYYYKVTDDKKLEFFLLRWA